MHKFVYNSFIKDLQNISGLEMCKFNFKTTLVFASLTCRNQMRYTAERGEEREAEKAGFAGSERQGGRGG